MIETEKVTKPIDIKFENNKEIMDFESIGQCFNALDGVADYVSYTLCDEETAERINLITSKLKSFIEVIDEMHDQIINILVGEPSEYRPESD